MKNLKKVTALLMAAILVLGMAGCSGGEKEEAKAAASDGAAGGSPLVGNASDEYYMVTFVSGLEYWQGCFEGMEDAAELFGVNVHYEGAPEYDVNAAITVLQQVIAKKPKGIAVTCMNADAYADTLNDAVAQGISVVTFDADSPDSDRACFLATTNTEAGKKGAEKLAELMNHKGKIGIIGCAGQSNHEERVEGFISYIEENEPDMEVVQVGNGETDTTTSATVAASMLQANPDIEGFFTSAAASCIGILSAVEEAGLQDKVSIVGFDTDAAVLDAVKEGKIDATVAQNTWQMGYWSMNMLYMMANDLLQDGWKEKNLAPLPNSVDTGTTIVTKENADSFYMKK